MVQPDQINIAMSFWYHAKSDFSSVRYYITGKLDFLQGTLNTRPCITWHPVVVVIY